MQALVTKSISDDVEMKRCGKRFNCGMPGSDKLVMLPQRSPLSRIKLRFPNLEEENVKAILKECDNDAMKVIDKLYGNKPRPSTNPFAASQNKAEVSRPRTSKKFLAKSKALGRKRRFSEIMDDDSPSSNEANSMAEEEEKEPALFQAPETDRRVQDFSDELFHRLKSAQTDQEARDLINSCMTTFKNESSDSENPKDNIKKRVINFKQKKICEAVKSLVSDNLTLKKAVRHFVEREEQSAQKVANFDKLAQQYNKVTQENEKLRNSVMILKYANKEKCNEGSFTGDFNHFDNSGGSGVF